MDRSEKTLEGNEAQESIGWNSAATSDNTTDSSDEESLEVVPNRALPAIRHRGDAVPGEEKTAGRQGSW